MTLRTMGLLAGLILVASSCGSSADRATADKRLDQIEAEVDAWVDSADLTEARAHAEAVANLIVGQGGFGYGDRDGDGEVRGQADDGLLPGPDGTPVGLVIDTVGSADCVSRDVLGGSWDNPVARWALFADAIGAWSSTNNTFPSLPSHPMRVIGWATLAQSGDFDEAIEYSSHAVAHVRISRNALSDC